MAHEPTPPRRENDPPDSDYTQFRAPRWLLIVQMIFMRLLGAVVLVYELVFDKQADFAQRFTFVAVALLLLLISELMRPGDLIRFINAVRGKTNDQS